MGGIITKNHLFWTTGWEGAKPRRRPTPLEESLKGVCSTYFIVGKVQVYTKINKYNHFYFIFLLSSGIDLDHYQSIVIQITTRSINKT